MGKPSFEIREIGQVLTVAIAALLLGSTLVLAAVGPAHATDATVLAQTPTTSAAAPYLA